MKRALALLLVCFLLPSCKIVNSANEFKGHGGIDLTFPINWIPGVEYVLPRIVLDVRGGFEWDNYDDKHRREMEKLRLLKEIEKRDETLLKDIFLDTLRSGDTDKLRVNN